MKTLEWRNVDKSSWGTGPWQDEPDAAQWNDPETGLPCLMVRSTVTGSLCGYVGVNEQHPLFKIPYGDLSDIDVHGGLTFAGLCAGEAGEGICHKPEPGEPDNIWWLGFDCAHGYDLTPRFKSFMPREFVLEDEVYRDLAYVKGECARLAAQLAKQGSSARTPRHSA